MIISRPTLPKSLSLEAPARVKNKAPPSDWPQEGEVVFDNVEMKYREDLPMVLKKLSCTIRPKEKVGIVGRTGSGWCCLLSCLALTFSDEISVCT